MKAIHLFHAIALAVVLSSAACQKKEAPGPQKKGSAPATQASPPAKTQATGEKPAPATRIDHVDAIEAAELLKKNPAIAVIDVRTPSEYSDGHLPNSININFRSDNFTEEAKKLDPAKTYLIHCQAGGRSTSSLDTFKKLGFKHIIHLDGGMMEWDEKNLPTEK